LVNSTAPFDFLRLQSKGYELLRHYSHSQKYLL
jgi:hypothetical protein